VPKLDSVLRTNSLATGGIFLFVAAVYVLAASGRIDIIDGQYRFEVAKNIVEDRSIQLLDPFLGFGVEGVIGVYSPYGIAGSLTGVPLVALANLLGPRSIDRQQFLFSFTSAIFGAATAALLFVFYVALGVGPRSAIGWTLVAAFATLTFPIAASVFDQVQHGFFVLAASFCAFLSARRDSLGFAIAGGAALAVLVNFQETYIIVLPTLAVAAAGALTTDTAARRRAIERAVVFMFVGGLGILLWMSINDFRFGSLLYSGKGNAGHPPALGNPLIGAPALLFSPGKSLFLYSPPTAAAIAGVWRLFKAQRPLGLAIILTSLAYFGMISSLSFFGGDWCWGPRYFASILPLLALGYPFLTLQARPARLVVRGTIVAGLCVQLLGLSVDHHRFFYGHSLPTFFWYWDPTYYFTHSALFSRPAEVIETIAGGVPPEAQEFRPGPYSGLLTYAVFGGWGHPELPAPKWMRLYQVFWLPRPWPLWMRAVPREQRPIHAAAAELVAVSGLLVGLCLVAPALRARTGAS
jgi:hypothetical protein